MVARNVENQPSSSQIKFTHYYFFLSPTALRLVGTALVFYAVSSISEFYFYIFYYENF